MPSLQRHYYIYFGNYKFLLLTKELLLFNSKENFKLKICCSEVICHIVFVAIVRNNWICKTSKKSRKSKMPDFLFFTLIKSDNLIKTSLCCLFFHIIQYFIFQLDWFLKKNLEAIKSFPFYFLLIKFPLYFVINTKFFQFLKMTW